MTTSTAFRVAALFARHMTEIILRAQAEGRNVWFFGRDMDMFYARLSEHNNVRYIEGVNTDVARTLHLEPGYRPEKAVNMLRNLGIKNGDWMIDSGFSGTVPVCVSQFLGIKTHIVMLHTGMHPEDGVIGITSVTNESESFCYNLVLRFEDLTKRNRCRYNGEVVQGTPHDAEIFWGNYSDFCKGWKYGMKRTWNQIVEEMKAKTI